MDSFIFKTFTSVMAGDNPTIQDVIGSPDSLVTVSAGHDPQEYEAVRSGSDVATTTGTWIDGMHVDPVIPSGGDVFEDPLLG